MRYAFVCVAAALILPLHKRRQKAVPHSLAICCNKGDFESDRNPNQCRRPDVLVLTNEQAAQIANTTAILSVAPPLVVEVVSPESVDRDYNRKVSEYAAAGIPEYWIVDPVENKVSVLLLTDGRYEATEFTGSQQIVSPTLNGLLLTAAQVLAAQLP